MRKMWIGMLALSVLSVGSMVGGCGHAEEPVGVRALSAYKAHDYKAALPLLKKWASTSEVVTNQNLRYQVVAYIVDTQNQLSRKVEADTAAPLTPRAAPVPVASLSAGAPASMPAAMLMALDPVTGGKRVPHTPIKTGEVAQMTIKELGNFEFDPNVDADVPADVKALNGSKVRLRGFILPLTQADRITDFALVPSLFNCCFGKAPGVEHIITCRIPKSKALEYVTDEVWVEGVLKVNVVRDQDYTSSIFEMDVTDVKVAE